MANNLTLEQGRLKSWNFINSQEGIKLVSEYVYTTQRQVELICRLIELCDDNIIYIDYGGDMLTKEKAKEYVRNCNASIISLKDDEF
jgi:hypothetical protein